MTEIDHGFPRFGGWRLLTRAALFWAGNSGGRPGFAEGYAKGDVRSCKLGTRVERVPPGWVDRSDELGERRAIVPRPLNGKLARKYCLPQPRRKGNRPRNRLQRKTRSRMAACALVRVPSNASNSVNMFSWTSTERARANLFRDERHIRTRVNQREHATDFIHSVEQRN